MLSAACSKDVVAPRAYPRVSTYSVTDINSTGVTLKGEITFTHDEVLDYGFIWSQPGGSELRIPFGTTKTSLPFEIRLDGGILKDQSYTVQAYAKSANYFVYGETVGFTGIGTPAPSITDFQPKEGTWGDTITVTGTHLGTYVVVAGVLAPLVSYTPTQLKFVVPSLTYLASDYVYIAISPLANLSVVPSSQKFTMKPPTITSFNPKAGTAGDQITIAGEYINPVYTSVYLDDAGLSNFHEVSKNTYVATVPPYLAKGNKVLKVSCGGQSVTSPINFVYQ